LRHLLLGGPEGGVERRVHGGRAGSPAPALPSADAQSRLCSADLRPAAPVSLFSLSELEAAADLVRAVVPATPCPFRPLLAREVGCEVWVKHENHSPIGAFKLRGGIVYLDWFKRSQTRARGVITATRGNHGQSVALAGRRAGVPVTIVVPHG